MLIKYIFRNIVMKKKIFLIYFLIFSFISFSNQQDIEKLNINIQKAFENMEIMKELLAQMIKAEDDKVIEITQIKEKVLDLEKKFENLNLVEKVERKEEQNKDISIELKKQKLIIDNFRFKNYGLSLVNKNKIIEFFDKLDLDNIEYIKIKGYSDSQGPDWYNNSISFLRAKEVYNYIVKNINIEVEKLEYDGYLYDDIDKSNLKNRRVELEIYFNK